MSMEDPVLEEFDRATESVLVRGAIDFLSNRTPTPTERAAIRGLLDRYRIPGYVTAMELALAFLGDDELDLDEALCHLAEHLGAEDRSLMSVEEHFARESAFREACSDFDRELGIEPDPDAPFEFPEPI